MEKMRDRQIRQLPHVSFSRAGNRKHVSSDAYFSGFVIQVRGPAAFSNEIQRVSKRHMKVMGSFGIERFVKLIGKTHDAPPNSFIEMNMICREEGRLCKIDQR
jgi:hypothetical protein